jgi:hypothetical protein
MATVIERVQAEPWFKTLPNQQQTIDSLMRDPHAQERVESILDKLDKDKDWKTLTQDQRKAQIMGVIEFERALRHERESLEELEWFEDLSPGDEQGVRETVEMNKRIQRATLRTVRTRDDKAIADTNPWSGVLRQGCP